MTVQPRKVLYIERKPHDFVSIERAFRRIADGLSERFRPEFQQMRYGNRFVDTIRNLLFFRKRKADIYHITGHIHYIALCFSPRNTVLSIMDIRFLQNESRLRRSVLKFLYLDMPVKRLRYITAISEATRREIIAATGCDESKVRALDLPLPLDIPDGETMPFNSAMPTILQVGTMKNKNIENLARALAGIECRVRIIGRLDEEQLSALKAHNIDYTNVYDLSDDEVREEYVRADMLAFCSLYEGFGLPIIEAQSMRKPVITSNFSPMVETSGNAAYLADPHSPESIRKGILKIINNAEFREQLIAAGLENVGRFQPERVAQQYADLYDEMIREEKL